jgi:hypothetical protein
MVVTSLRGFVLRGLAVERAVELAIVTVDLSLVLTERE